ncbi:MAG TPA: ABC transporter permease [Bryobacteraceae bacterium]|nr:ABC transporter permease [Bryobacteraceae bacterium]
MGALWQRLISLFRAGSLDRELADEIEIHLAMQEAEFQQQGMDPGAARQAALREFGGVAQAQEAYRERRGIPWIETAVKDSRYALRGLARSPGFTAAAVLSLALGIGANTAIFSLFHTLMLRMLPVSHPEQLVTLYRSGGWGRGTTSYPLYLEVQKRTDLFQGVVARSGVGKAQFRYGQADQPGTVQREFVSGNYFTVLGVTPALGRLISADDNRTPHAHPLAVLNYDFWQGRFAADPGVLGRTIVVEDVPLNVIGVAARGFRGVEVDHHPDLWEPAMMTKGEIMQPGMYWLWILGRRRPDVSRQQIQAAIDILLKQHLAGVYGAHSNAAFRKTAMAQQIEVREGGIGLSMLRDQFGQPLAVLMAAVALVLLAACANVANLLLARGAARRKEIAVRLSLGATRGRLVRQGLMESLLLAVSGCLLGVLLAFWGDHAILQFLPPASGEPFTATPNALVLAFTLGISLLSVVLFGVAPAVRSTAVHPADSVKSGVGQASGRQSRMRKALVVSQVAFSATLVALAGLFGHSLTVLRSTDMGFRNQKVVSSSLEFPGGWKADQVRAARERLFTQLESSPGVSMVSWGFPGPFQGGSSNASILVPGSPVADKEPIWVDVQRVGPHFFEILDGAPAAGREFDRNDRSGARKVALVNQAFVGRVLAGDPHPLARVLSFEMAKIDPTYIVGVVRDIPHQGLREKIVPTVYLPIAQSSEQQWGDILVRSQLPGDEVARVITREVAHLGPGIKGSQPRTIRQHIDESIFQDRLLATVGGFFGGLALLLAAIGLYGVVAYGMAWRTREIGIRIALGARRGAVLWMALGDALLLVSLGLVLGLPLAFAAGRTVSTVLFGVKPADAVTFAGTAGVLVAVALAAAFVPARRAASIEPVQVLREE